MAEEEKGTGGGKRAAGNQQQQDPQPAQPPLPPLPPSALNWKPMALGRVSADVGRPTSGGRPSRSSVSAQGRTSRISIAAQGKVAGSGLASRQSVSGPRPSVVTPRRSTIVKLRVPEDEGPAPGGLGTIAPKSSADEEKGRGPARASFSQDKRTASAAKRRGRVLCESAISEDLQGINCLGFTNDGSLLTCGFGNGSIQIRRADTMGLRQTVRSGLGTRVPMMWVRFHPKKAARYYIASSCGRVYSGTVASGDYTVFSYEDNNELNALDITCDAEKLITGGRDTKVRVYDMGTSKLTQVYEVKQLEQGVELSRRPHSERIWAVRAHKTREYLALTAGWDDNVKIWDLRQPKLCIGTMNGPHICGDALDVEDELVITGSWVVDGSLQTWDLRQMKRIETIVPINRKRTIKGDFLYVAKFLDGDPTRDLVFVGGSGLPEAELISLQKKEVMCTFPTGGAVHTMDSNKNIVAYGGGYDLLRIGEYNPAA